MDIFDAESFVILGFMIFVLVVLYFGAHKKIAAVLDSRSQHIRDELAEAESLRKEAAALLASFEKKKVEAEVEAAEIVARAKAEAAAIAKEAQIRLNDFVTRRSQQADTKIALAEAQAMQDVRTSAIDLAVAAAGQLLQSNFSKNANSVAVDKAIADLKAQLC